MKLPVRLLFLPILICFGHSTYAQLIVNSGLTPQQLVQNLLGTGVTVSNITYTGAAMASGTFNGAASNIGLASGVLLTTGSVTVAPGPNTLGSAGTDNMLGGYALLDSLSGVPTFDAAILEFDFTPMADTIRFRYVFASEEYNEFVCGSVNDAFGFFISGPGITGQQNVALIPGTTTPVSINTLNDGSCGSSGSFHAGCDLSHAIYFIDNTGGTSVQYDGFTTILTAEAVVTPCLTYHIRLAIADGGDHAYDSGVFLEAGSFHGVNPVVATATPTSGIQLPNGILSCAPFVATFANTSTGTTHFIWDFGDGGPPDTTANPSHTYVQNGTFNVSLIASDTTACNFSDTAYFTVIVDSGAVSPGFNLTKSGICDSIHIDVTSTSTGVQLYDWNFGDGTTASGTLNSHSYYVPGTYQVYHIVSDTICNIVDTVIQAVTLLPRLHTVINATQDEGCSPLAIALCDLGNFTPASHHQWTFGNGVSSSALCDSVFYTTPGIYRAQLFVTDTSFCNPTDNSYVDIHVKVRPDAAFNLPDSQNVYYPLSFDNATVNGLTSYWDFGDGQYSSEGIPEHQYTMPGIYNICLTSTNDACFDSICHELIVFESPVEIWFPAGFTPNGDGKNDFFSPVGTGIASFQMLIYNHWGEKMFESNAVKNGWDGTYKGKPAENGVYVFHIQATMLNGKAIEKYGTVTIFK